VPEPVLVSLDAVVRLVVRDVFRDELARALAPIVERLDALTAAAPPATIDLTTYAERNGVAVATARRWAAAGKLKGAVRVGRSWRVDVRAAVPATDDEIAALAAAARGAP
jgi:hypothetical protein